MVYPSFSTSQRIVFGIPYAAHDDFSGRPFDKLGSFQGLYMAIMIGLIGISIPLTMTALISKLGVDFATRLIIRILDTNDGSVN